MAAKGAQGYAWRSAIPRAEEASGLAPHLSSDLVSSGPGLVNGSKSILRQQPRCPYSSTEARPRDAMPRIDLANYPECFLG